MKTKITSLLAVTVLVLLLGAPAWATTQYSNGPINGTINAFIIDGGEWVSNSFTMSSSSTLTGAQIGIWATPGDTLSTVGWTIGSSPDTSNLGSGTATVLDNTLLFTNGDGWDIYRSTFPLTATLSTGTTYWLTLQNATVNVPDNGDNIFWDTNNGPSQLETSISPILVNGYGSESFLVYDGSEPTSPLGVVPEPSTMLLLGSGLLGLWGAKRKFKK